MTFTFSVKLAINVGRAIDHQVLFQYAIHLFCASFVIVLLKFGKSLLIIGSDAVICMLCNLHWLTLWWSHVKSFRLDALAAYCLAS